MENLLTIKEASVWATNFLGKSVTPSNIAYLINYGRVNKISEYYKISASCKRIHRRLPPKKVKFYFKVWLCALSSTLVYSCGGETADETNLNDALNRASEADLPALGLKRTTQDNRIYWIPDQN